MIKNLIEISVSLILKVKVQYFFCLVLLAFSSLSYATINECGNDVNGSGNGSGFSGYYAPENWIIDDLGTLGTISFNAPSSATIVGPNNIALNNTQCYIETTVLTSGTFTFSWSWTTVDLPQFDPAFYQINTQVFQLTNSSGSANQSGSVSFNAVAGDEIRFGVISTDGCCGAATLNITGFIWPGQCPLNECGNYVNDQGVGSGYNGYYAPGEWSTNLNGGSGTITVNLPNTLVIQGNNNSLSGVQTSFTTNAIIAGTISFDWSWITTDSPQFDPAFVVINGSQTNLTANTLSAQTGSFVFLVEAGDTFGFGVDATDGCCGSASLTVTNFQWPGQCNTGCTDPAACNFNPLATSNDGSCLFAGCNNPTALNYDPNAQCDSGSCIFGLPNDVCGGAQSLNVINGVEFIIGGSNSAASTDFTTESCFGFGVIQQDRWYSFVATGGTIAILGDPFLGGSFSPSIALFSECGGIAIACAPQIMLSPTVIFMECGQLMEGHTYYLQVGGGPLDPSLFYRLRIQQSASVSGCTNPLACNFNADATCDNGNCLGAQSGCTDPLSCNFDPNVCESDPNACIYPDCQGDCFGFSYIDACGQCIPATYTEREIVFLHSGQEVEFVVPPFVSEIEVECYGASGGNSSLWEMNTFGTQLIQVGKTGIGGKGGRASGILSVTPGESIFVMCGGSGDNGGFNGGGFSSSSANFLYTDGGGATDIRLLANDPSSRRIVAGGGGGSSTVLNLSFTTVGYSSGGNGGGLIGSNGDGSEGGSQTSGGNPNSSNGGAGGGGGWFSGEAGSSGAGGSSFFGGVQNGLTSGGINSGNGYAILRYTDVTFSNQFCSFGCTDSEATNFSASAVSDDGSCIYYGCIDPLAINFNPQATIGDYSCQFTEGCTYLDASNYNPSAIKDDGTCAFDEQSSCPADLNLDGLVGITDLLIFLSAYGSTCP